MRVVFLILAVLQVVVADLPSCERARCIHCAVDFIAKSCPNVCSACAYGRAVTPVSSTNSFNQQQQIVQPQQFHNQPQQPKLPQQPPVLSQNHYVKKVAQPLPVRQAGVQQHVASQQQYVQTQNYRRAQAFGAPQQPAQYAVQASTLAPIFEHPNPDSLNPQLAKQPADLAQPLPEYTGQGGSYQPASFLPQQNQQPQLYAHFPQQQFGFGQQHQQSPQLFNPFQSFLGNNQQSSPLDFLGLFNAQNGLINPLAPQQNVGFQGTYPSPGAGQTQSVPLGQVPSAVQSAPTAQTQPQVFPHSQLPQLQMPQLQLPQMPTLPSPPAPVTIQHAGSPFASPQSQTQPQQYATNQQAPAQVQPQLPAQQPQQQVVQQRPQPQPLPQTSSSIDSTPVNYHKYVDGKGPAAASGPVAQCPRQPGWAPCITKETANQRFRNCCQRLGDGCAALCNYDATLATMQLAVLTGRCPLAKVADMMVCASGYVDATPCCEAYNVFEPGYEQCRPYCNPAAGLPQGGLLSEKYKCLAKLSVIQQCFYVSQKP